MPGAIADIRSAGGAQFVSVARPGHVDPEVAAALSEYPPTPIVAAVPILVGDERRVVHLICVVHPHGHGKVDRAVKLQVWWISERGVVDRRAVRRRCELERLP